MDTTQFMKSTNGTIITVGKPYTFKSGIYGDTAVHVTAIYGDVIHFTIDGGEASRQVREFPELEDGTFYALSQRIERRPTRKPARPGKNPVQVLAEQAGIVKSAEKTVVAQFGAPGVVVAGITNTIREVPGIGKVAFVSAPSAPRKRRMSFLQALDAADDMRTQFNWAQPGVETF